MANPYKTADKKQKTPPGGRHIEEKENILETSPVTIQEAVVEETPTAETVPAVEHKEIKEEKKEAAPVAETSTLASIYADKRKSEIEARTVRIQAVVTPSIAAKLDALANGNIIKSRNDLINFLIESYLETLPQDLLEELLRKS